MEVAQGDCDQARAMPRPPGQRIERVLLFLLFPLLFPFSLFPARSRPAPQQRMRDIALLVRGMVSRPFPPFPLSSPSFLSFFL